jgi:hypothetical protein
VLLKPESQLVFFSKVKDKMVDPNLVVEFSNLITKLSASKNFTKNFKDLFKKSLGME